MLNLSSWSRGRIARVQLVVAILLAIGLSFGSPFLSVIAHIAAGIWAYCLFFGSEGFRNWNLAKTATFTGFAVLGFCSLVTVATEE